MKSSDVAVDVADAIDQEIDTPAPHLCQEHTMDNVTMAGSRSRTSDDRRAASTHWHVLRSQETRTPRPLNIIGEQTLVKVSPTDSDGLLAVFQCTVPPHSGPALHVHSREDEAFFVLDGELVFEVEGERHTVTAGDSLYVRRGVAHTYQNFTKTDAQLLFATTPGGFFDFFIELDRATPPAGVPVLEVLNELCEKYGISILGPPLTA